MKPLLIMKSNDLNFVSILLTKSSNFESKTEAGVIFVSSIILINF